MKKLSVLFLMSICCLSSFANNLPDFPFVVAKGFAEVEVKPDVATIQLRIEAVAPESDLALGKVNIATTAVINAIEKYKIPLENITATDIEKSTRRNRGGSMNQLEVIGYQVSRNMTINLDDISHYAELMSDIVSIDNIYNANASFDVKKRNEIKASLMQSASDDAKQRAHQMAESLGTKIHSVYAISESNSFDSLFASFGAQSYQSARPEMRAKMIQSSTGGTLMFVPKSINISKSINVVFRIK
jgi:uncharacterized protein